MNKRLVQLYAKVMNVLYYVLHAKEFNHIFTYNSAKEIWDRLEVICEGPKQ